MAAVGFEPTPPKRLVPETSALDRSAIQPRHHANQSVDPFFFQTNKIFRAKKDQNDWSGIQTHASEETSA